MEVSEVRRRVRAAIETAKQAAADRRVRNDVAARDYDLFLTHRAVPVFQQVAAALTSEGHPFKVFTPAGSVRLASDRSPEEFIELTLDTASDPPEVRGQVSRGRGRRMISEERPVRPQTPIADLTDEHVLDYLTREVALLV